jgi:hypothetical protein
MRMISLPPAHPVSTAETSVEKQIKLIHQKYRRSASRVLTRRPAMDGTELSRGGVI